MKTATASKKHPASATPDARGNEWLFWLASAAAVVCAAVFFQFSNGDAGEIGRALGEFPAAFDKFSLLALRDSLLGGLTAALVVVAWFGFGGAVADLLERFAGGSEAKSMTWFVSTRCAWGAGLSSLLMFLAGVTRLYTRAVAVVILAIGLALAFKAIAKIRELLKLRNKGGDRSRVGALLVLVPLVLCAIAALAPPVAKDTLLYHISLPKVFVESRGLADVRYNIAQFYALGAELNGTWGMLLGRVANARVGEGAFGLIQFAYFPVLLAAVYGWMRQLGRSALECVVPVVIIALVPTFWSSASSGYNDCALALYVTLAIAASVQWWRKPDRRSAVELGLAIGFGLGVKLLALFLIPPLTILLLLRLRDVQENPSEMREALKAALISAVVAVCVAAPWYVRNWVRTGSPVFPFYMNIFHGSAPGWDEQRSVIDQFLNARYGGYPKGVLDYAAAPFRLSFSAQPDIPKYFDGVLGISFLVGALLVAAALMRRRLSAEGQIAAGLSGAFFLCWVFTSEQLRYLLPALPAFAVAISVSAYALDRRLRYVLLGSVLPGAIVICAWFLQQNPAAVALGFESRDHYLERSLDHYKMYEVVNSKLPADARLWLINMRRDTYYIERPYFSDFRIEHHTLVELVKSSSSAAEMNQRAREMGMTHLLFTQDTLLDPATTPIIDDRLSPDENSRRLAMAREFLFGDHVVAQEGRFVLTQLR